MKYVVAVSGGVDSIVLLDMLVTGNCQSHNFDRQDIVVAHFDHGIRNDSSSDEKFVRGVVGEYGLRYETGRTELGAGASEDMARNERYKFLRQSCKNNNARLITAHHQDDLLETMIINLIRGTNWRGLVSLDSADIYRPLLTVPKSELLSYAKKHNLQWREDSTNTDDTYLRNYVRLNLVPSMQQKDPQALSKLLVIHQKTLKLKKEIATELQNYSTKYQISNIKYKLPRYQLTMLPPLAAHEIIYHVLTCLDSNWHPSTLQLKRALHFAKTGLPGKVLEVSKSLKLSIKNSSVQFIKR